jgi:hypothetical protein
LLAAVLEVKGLSMELVLRQAAAVPVDIELDPLLSIPEHIQFRLVEVVPIVLMHIRAILHIFLDLV